MKTVKTFKIVVFLIIAPCLGFAQNRESSENCKQLILDYLQKMEAVNSPKEGDVYNVKYTMSTQFSKESGLSSKVAKTEILTTSDKIAIYDDAMQVYGDENNIFVVVPNAQKIYWNSSDSRVFNDVNSYKKFIELQRILLNTAQQIRGEYVDEILMISVTPSKEFTSKSKLTKQQLSFSTSEKRIIKVTNFYNQSSALISQAIVYDVLDFKSAKTIPDPITVLFNDNKLKSTYKGFEIIDNRKN